MFVYQNNDEAKRVFNIEFSVILQGLVRPSYAACYRSPTRFIRQYEHFLGKLVAFPQVFREHFRRIQFWGDVKYRFPSRSVVGNIGPFDWLQQRPEFISYALNGSIWVGVTN